jgi:hypothetical protein
MIIMVKILIAILWIMMLRCSVVMDTSMSGKCQVEVVQKK